MTLDKILHPIRTIRNLLRKKKRQVTKFPTDVSVSPHVIKIPEISMNVKFTEAAKKLMEDKIFGPRLSHYDIYGDNIMLDNIKIDGTSMYNKIQMDNYKGVILDGPKAGVPVIYDKEKRYWVPDEQTNS